MESIQFYNMRECGWADIGCNFLISGDGNVFVGRGWLQHGAHTKEYKNAQHKRQLLVLKKLIEEGVKLKMIAEDYRLYCHRQLRPQFNNPDLELFKIIQKWDHWSAEIL